MRAVKTTAVEAEHYWSDDGTLCGTVSIEALKRFKAARKKCSDDLQAFEVASKPPRGVKKGETEDEVLIGLYTLARFEYGLLPAALGGIIRPNMSTAQAFLEKAQEVCGKYIIYTGKVAA